MPFASIVNGGVTTWINTRYIDLFVAYYDEEKVSHWNIGSNSDNFIFGTFDSLEESKGVAFMLIRKLSSDNPEIIIGEDEVSNYYGALYREWIIYIAINGVIFIGERKHIKMFKIDGDKATIKYKDYEEYTCNIPRHIHNGFKELMARAMI